MKLVYGVCSIAFILQVQELVRYLCEQMKYEHPVSMNVIVSFQECVRSIALPNDNAHTGGDVTGSGH